MADFVLSKEMNYEIHMYTYTYNCVLLSHTHSRCTNMCLILLKIVLLQRVHVFINVLSF